MKAKGMIGLLLVTFFLLRTFSAFAFETDQYNLPSEPLADIGNEVNDYALENIRKAVGKTVGWGRMTEKAYYGFWGGGRLFECRSGGELRGHEVLRKSDARD